MTRGTRLAPHSAAGKILSVAGAIAARKPLLSTARPMRALLNSFLRSASSRIGRRFAEIVAIAAAGLPAAGA
jgi:hypothetical protein